MASEEKIPPAGESVTEVTFIKFTQPDGAAVNEGDPIAEVETDKANADLFASTKGVLTYAAGIAAGSVIKIGTVFATIDANAKAAEPKSTPSTGASHSGPVGTNQPSNAPAATGTAVTGATTGTLPPPPAAPSKVGNVEDLSPAARRAATEGNVDVSKLAGTGPNGRITKEDVEGTAAARPATTTAGGVPPNAGASQQPSVPPTPNAPTTQPSQPTQPTQFSQPTVQSSPASSANGTRRAPMSKIRKRIAENLVRAKNTTAMLTTFNEVDMTAIMRLREQYKAPFEKRHGIGLGFMSFFVKACCVALRDFERVNGQIDGDDFVLFDYVHMGVAVSTERGLTVPVLKNAQNMGLAKIESEIKRVATAARDGKLGFDEMSGGTFTITNGGVFGSLLSTPILNLPQSAILGMHTIQQRPMAVDGKVEVRPMMYLALSYDHRIIDGKESVSFLVRLKQLLEDPTRLVLDV